MLSSLLFAVMINDLPTCLNSEVAIFADGVCFGETDTDITVLNKLGQSSLNKINAWCNVNGFKMSINKSPALLFTKKCKNKQVSLILNNQTIEVKHQFKYLGIIFQENGLYNAHVSYVHDKCFKRINLLWMLKGTSWGVSKDPLFCIYRALIRPIIECGMEIYFNSSDSTLKQIEKIQTECLRICAGAMRSTPINCLQVHCNEMPLKLIFEQLCLNFRAYLRTFANHPSSFVIQDSWQERFPDNPGFCSFNMRTKCFFDKLNMNLNAIVLPNISIWQINKPVIDLNIFFLCKKNDNTNLIRSCFSYVINTDYADFTLLFTDGTKSQHGTSSAFFPPQTNTKRSIAINSLGSAFSAKLYAILSALHWIAINRPCKSVIVTDCYSVLQALNSKKWGKHYILNKILLLNHYLTNSNLKVTFLWVPTL